jgi:hypothetical protein
LRKIWWWCVCCHLKFSLPDELFRVLALVCSGKQSKVQSPSSNAQRPLTHRTRFFRVSHYDSTYQRQTLDLGLALKPPILVSTWIHCRTG